VEYKVIDMFFFSYKLH